MLAHGHGDPVAQAQVSLHRLAAQVEHAVLQPGVLGEVVVVQLEGRRRRRIEHLDLVRQHLHLAGAQGGIGRTLGPAPDQARDPQHVLASRAIGGRERRRPVRIADHLRQPVAVAQVDEDHAAVVAAPVRPAAQGHRAADQGGAQLAAIVRAHVG